MIGFHARLHQNRSNRVQGGAQSRENVNLIRCATREYDPFPVSGRSMNEVRRSIIRLRDNDDPTVIGRIVSATIADPCCGNITGRCQPLG